MARRIRTGLAACGLLAVAARDRGIALSDEPRLQALAPAMAAVVAARLPESVEPGGAGSRGPIISREAVGPGATFSLGGRAFGDQVGQVVLAEADVEACIDDVEGVGPEIARSVRASWADAPSAWSWVEVDDEVVETDDEEEEVSGGRHPRETGDPGR